MTPPFYRSKFQDLTVIIFFFNKARSPSASNMTNLVSKLRIGNSFLDESTEEKWLQKLSSRRHILFKVKTLTKIFQITFNVSLNLIIIILILFFIGLTRASKCYFWSLDFIMSLSRYLWAYLYKCNCYVTYYLVSKMYHAHKVSDAMYKK